LVDNRVTLYRKLTEFPLCYSSGESANANKMQVYGVLIVQLLLAMIRRNAATKKSFVNRIGFIRLHLMSHVKLLEFVKGTFIARRKTDNVSFAF
jgi:hypothetical protein